VPGVVGRGRPRLGWKEQVEKDMLKVGLRSDEAMVRCLLRHGIQELS
jgi:hypothetical protein